MAYEIKLSDLKRILRRRKGVLIGTFGLVFCAFLVTAFILPPIYRARVMIIIENQEIPQEYVRSMTTDFIGERLSILEREIMSFSKLLDIIQTNDLYPELSSNSQMVSQMRKNIKISTEDVSVGGDRRTGGRIGFATIAFTLAYEHKNPHKAALVANILSNLFVEKDRQSRENRAGITTDFLEKELDDLRRQVREYEERISRFRAANIDQLPGSTGIFQQTVFRLEQDIERIDSRIRTLTEKNVYLQSQIANIDPLVPILTEGGRVAASPANRLKFLRLQLIQMQANLSDRHPDIIRLKSEIAKLEAQVGESNTTQEQANRLIMLEKEIAAAKSRFGDRHPDVVRLSREADLLKQQLAQQEMPGSTTVSVDARSDNPEYMNLRAQIIVTESEIESLREQRIKAAQQLNDYQRRLEMAPFIDEQYNALTLDFENSKRKFNEVSNKLHTAKIAQELDLSERGERFRINSPAHTPDMPSKPNRIAIILMGLMAGLGCAVLLTALAEGFDSSIKAPDEFENILGVPVLATISYYDSSEHKRQRWIKRAVLVSSIIAFVFVGSLVVDRFLMPLSVIWNTVEDRLIEMGVPIMRDLVDS